MKIAIDHMDGRYSMYDPSQCTFAEGVDPEAWTNTYTIDIPESEWTAYQVFMEQYRLWQDRMNVYSNIIHERREQLEKQHGNNL